jgi:hypothetical protein
MQDAKKLEDIIKSIVRRFKKRSKRFCIVFVRGKKKPTFSWSGGLSKFKDQYTSVELQHKISKWRIEEE